MGWKNHNSRFTRAYHGFSITFLGVTGPLLPFGAADTRLAHGEDSTPSVLSCLC